MHESLQQSRTETYTVPMLAAPAAWTQEGLLGLHTSGASSLNPKGLCEGPERLICCPGAMPGAQAGAGRGTLFIELATVSRGLTAPAGPELGLFLPLWVVLIFLLGAALGDPGDSSFLPTLLFPASSSRHDAEARAGCQAGHCHGSHAAHQAWKSRPAAEGPPETPNINAASAPRVHWREGPGDSC